MSEDTNSAGTTSAPDAGTGSSPAPSAGLPAGSSSTEEHLRRLGFTEDAAHRAVSSARVLVWAVLAVLVLSTLLYAGRGLAQTPNPSTIQFHAVNKSLMVEDLTEFSIWITGYVEGSASKQTVALTRANASVPALIQMLVKKEPLRLVAPGDKTRAFMVQGIRITYATKTMANGRIDSRLMADPLRLPAGRYIEFSYSADTGAIVFQPPK